MLRWRLVLGVAIIGALIGLCWLDHRAATPGVWLLPVLAVFALLGTHETLEMLAIGGMRPVRWPVYAGVIAILAVNWLPRPAGSHCGTLGWSMAALGLALLAVFAAEMRRFRQPGGVTANVAGAVLALVYIGVCLALAVQLRMQWGIGALASVILVVKCGDTGAYTVGRLIGRHKLAPALSPGKTIEGAVGAIAAAVLAAWAAFAWLIPAINGGQNSTPTWGWVVYGIAVGLAGMLGDLAESLVKRDAGQKDSSTWLPGFGGILDILDSILLAAPVAYLLWSAGVVRLPTG